MEPYISLRSKMVLTIGTSIGIFFSGMAVILGFSSILLLSSKKGPVSRQDSLLRIYTTVLLFLGVAFQIQYLFNVDLSIALPFEPVDKGYKVLAISTMAFDATLILIINLTDGLLVWRCFMVQRALGNTSSKWGNISWAFPASLWIVELGLSIATSVLNDNVWFFLFALLAFIGNAVLNLYATLFISIRLLLHRRMVMACTKDSGLIVQHIYIVGIFLGSAMINLPLAIVAAVAAGVKGMTLVRIMLPIGIATQVFASVLIIYQSALGRVFSRRREDSQTRDLTEMREIVISGNSELNA